MWTSGEDTSQCFLSRDIQLSMLVLLLSVTGQFFSLLVPWENYRGGAELACPSGGLEFLSCILLAFLRGWCS